MIHLGRRSYDVTEKKVRFCATLSYNYKKRLDVLCSKTSKSASSLLNDALGDLLDKYESCGVYSDISHAEDKNGEDMKMLEPDGKNHAGTSMIIANHKGGVGKTTTTASLAILASKKDKKILLIDLDAQMNLSNLFGYGNDRDNKNVAGYIGQCINCIVDDNEDYPDINEVIQGTTYKNIDIITASSRMRDDSFGSAIMKANNTLITQTVFDIMIDKIKSLNIYDYILVDSSPNMNTTILSAIRAVDWVIAPTDVDVDGFKGAYKINTFIKSVEKRGVKVAKLAGVVFNRANASRGMTKAVPEFRTQFVNADIHCFDTVIPEMAIVSNEKISSRIAVDVRPTSKITKKYASLLDEVVNIIG